MAVVFRFGWTDGFDTGSVVPFVRCPSLPSVAVPSVAVAVVAAACLWEEDPFVIIVSGFFVSSV